MKKNKKFIPVMLMPFLKDGNIDYNSLNQLIEFYLHAGAGGLFANCLSSEMFNLTQQEMIDTVSFIVKKVDGRVPVVATGTFEDVIPNQAEFVKAIYNTGVQSVIVITSLLAKESDSEEVFENNVMELLDLTLGIPLGFYECPLPYKRIISSDFLGRLASTGRVKYHKDTSLSITNVQDKILATKKYEEFGLYDAYMVHAVDSLISGSAGLSCIQGNYFPELVVWLCNNYDKEELGTDVQIIQKFFAENMDLMHDNYPTSAKYTLGKRNLTINEYCRTVKKELDEHTRLDLDQLYDEFSLLCEKLGIDTNYIRM